ncbi:tRNA 2-thiocytidine biosynthesis protein ttcA [Elysia marginata]|uniref:tRNA 2-thiocytidine biosynthesis protein ttcA n=1 Tax=Elysia marginata TaxID=1093978 RepID=A0AAV4I3T6_9GAST|nr:tRNA 2-thiocytidine biosynthesis protein ttcA [Elysia marginata]
MNTNNRSTRGIETEYDKVYEVHKPHSSKTKTHKGVEPHKGGDVVSLFSGDDGEDLLEEELDEAAKNELCSFLFKNIVGYDFIFRGPFGRNVVTYLDYIASGRPLKCIETYIRHNVMPTYANTHTEVNYFAQQTTIMREEARSIIKKSVNASEDDAVIFCGSGATAAVHKLIHAMDIQKATVLVGPYEHHSNILPWKEINAKVVRLRQNKNGLIDMDHLNAELKKCEQRLCGIGETTLIDAIFISSHKFVGGPQTPGILVAKRWLFRNRIPHGVGGGTVAFVTRQHHYYRRQVDQREEGGTPGIIESIRAGLVFKLKNALGASFIMERETALFRLAAESWSVNPRLVILGSLKPERLPIFPLLFFQEQVGRFVHHDFIALVLNDLFGIQVRSGCACAAPYGMDLLGINDKVMKRLDKIIIDHNGPQSEPVGGKGRTSTYTYDDMSEEGAECPKPKRNINSNSPIDTSPLHVGSPLAKNIIFKPGFVRLNFPYFISEECFDFVIKAIEMVADKGWSLLPLYKYDRDTGAWSFDDKSKKFHRKKSLNDITFAHGRFDLKKIPKVTPGPPQIGDKTIKETPSPTESLPSLSDGFPGFNYQEIIERAELVFQETMTPGKFIVQDQTSEFTGEADKLRWFMLPSEASSIVNNRKVDQMRPQECPYKPMVIPERTTRGFAEDEWWWIRYRTIIIWLCFVPIAFFIYLVWIFVKQMKPEDRPILPAIFNLSEASETLLLSATSELPSTTEGSDTSSDDLYSTWEGS